MVAPRTFLVLGAAFGLSGCLTSPDLLHSGSDMRIPIERAQFSMDLVPGPADGERHIEVTHSRGLYRLRMTPPIDASGVESRAVFLALPGNENRIRRSGRQVRSNVFLYGNRKRCPQSLGPGSNLEDLIDAAAPNASFAAYLWNPFRNISESSSGKRSGGHRQSSSLHVREFYLAAGALARRALPGHECLAFGRWQRLDRARLYVSVELVAGIGGRARRERYHDGDRSLMRGWHRGKSISRPISRSGPPWTRKTLRCRLRTAEGCHAAFAAAVADRGSGADPDPSPDKCKARHRVRLPLLSCRGFITIGSISRSVLPFSPAAGFIRGHSGLTVANLRQEGTSHKFTLVNEALDAGVRPAVHQPEQSRFLLPRHDGRGE